MGPTPQEEAAPRAGVRRQAGRARWRPMQVADFDFELPEELIAQAPISPRDASRLLHLPAEGAGRPPGLRRAAGAAARAGDLLVFNDTGSSRPGCSGVKEATGGKVEMLLVDPRGAGPAARAGGPWGSRASRSGPGRGSASASSGRWWWRWRGRGSTTLELDREGDALEAALAASGRLPLPPYIRRDADRRGRRAVPDHLRGGARAAPPRRPPASTSRPGSWPRSRRGAWSGPR